MLKLLARPLFVTIRDSSIVDLLDVGKAVDNKCAKQNCVAHLVTLNREANQVGQGF